MSQGPTSKLQHDRIQLNGQNPCSPAVSSNGNRSTWSEANILIEIWQKAAKIFKVVIWSPFFTGRNILYARYPSQTKYLKWDIKIRPFYLQTFLLPEASFGLRVLSLPASVCVSVCLSVCHLLVRAIARDPFKLESPNLDQKCKIPWLRSLLFCGLIHLDLQGQI